MLVRFSAENFRCFRERVELSMVAASLDRHLDHVVAGQTPRDIPLLKLAVIYGANASGNSNLVRALETARRIILLPAEAGKPLPVVPYKLDTEYLHRPSRFEFEIKVRDRYFAYGFVASARQVEEEWLYELDSGRESCIFERVGPTFRSPGLRFANPEEEQFFRFTAKGTLPNRLFLTECRERNLQENVATAGVLFDVLRWFEDGLQTIFPGSSFRGLAQEVRSNQVFKDELSRYLHCFDTGVEGVDLEEVAVDQLGLPEEVRQKVSDEVKDGQSVLLELPWGVRLLVGRAGNGDVRAWRLVARHTQRGATAPVLFDLNEESDGTRRLADLAPVLIRLLGGEHVFVVDEFDRSLHPDIAHSLLANFLRHSAGRPSQLIVTTHETTLLRQDFLRPDEVWFTENRPGQGCRLVSLAEYKLEGSKDLQQDYLQGRFGGVPVLHDFSWLGERDAKGT
jgi:AAA15 family ATPase/GTPase